MQGSHYLIVSQLETNTRESLSARVSYVHPSDPIVSSGNEIRYVERSGGRKPTDAHILTPVES